MASTIFCRAVRTAMPLLFFLLGFVSTSRAQNEKSTVENCGDLSSQSEMNDCAARAAKKADGELNALYRKLLEKTARDKTATEKVVAAERAWIAFRDAELAAEWPVGKGEDPSVLYGSVHPLCYYSAYAAMTRDRLNTLKALMQHVEGDVCGSGLAQGRQREPSRTCNANMKKPSPTARKPA